MDKLNKVEKIKEKTGVSYEEAKEALEAAGGDILDALVWLESKGKINEPEVSVYTTEEEASEEFEEAAKAYDNTDKETAGDVVKKIFNWLGNLIKKGCENFFIIEKNDKEVLTMPVILLVILLLSAFWVTLPLIIVGLFLGYRYSFKGEITKAVDVNTACDKAAEAAENIKQEFTK